MCGKWILAHICYAFGFAPRIGCESLSASVALARTPLSVSASWACLISTMSRLPHAPTPSLCTVGPPCPLRLHREPSLTSAHARRAPQPCRLPTHPSSLLSTAHTALSPTSIRSSSPSLALCPHRSRSPEFRSHRAGHLARQKLRQATPSSVPR
jgi:hypothetical protein